MAETYEPRVGDIVIERHAQAQERRIAGIHGDRVSMVGIASGRNTWASLENVRRRYTLVSRTKR